MAEYAILLATTTGSRLLEHVKSALVDDPTLVWGGGALLLVLLVWVLKPTR